MAAGLSMCVCLTDEVELQCIFLFTHSDSMYEAELRLNFVFVFHYFVFFLFAFLGLLFAALSESWSPWCLNHLMGLNWPIGPSWLCRYFYIFISSVCKVQETLCFS